MAKSTDRMTPQEQEAMSSSISTTSSQTLQNPLLNDISKNYFNNPKLHTSYSDNENLHEDSAFRKVSYTDNNISNEERENFITIAMTELRTSKSLDLSLQTTYPTEKSSRPCQVTPLGVDWHQPFYMLSLFIIGLVGMICHHVYNSAMDEKVVVHLQWPQRFGSALSFFAKLCMVSSVSIAYKQVAWLRIKKQDYSISTLDGIFSICNDPFRYLDFELLLKATVPAIMAALVWGLPICAIVSPSTLTSTTGFQEVPMTCDDIPTIDFQKENGANAASIFMQGQAMSYFTLNPNDNFTYYFDQPSMDLSKVARLSLLSSNPLTLPNPCGSGINCTWEYSFFGPSYDCQERDDFDNSTGLSKSQLVPTGQNIYYSVSTGSEDKYGRPEFWKYETSHNDSDIGTFDIEPVMWIGYVYNTTEFLGWDEPWPYLLEPHVIECTLYNTTYNYNMRFVDGIQIIDNLTKTLVSPALPASSSIAPADPNYEAFAAYHGAGFVFRDQLSKNITQPTGQGMTAYATANSEIAQTSLIDSDTSFAIPDFPTKVEEQFSNIILSLAAYPSLYSQVNISGPCIKTATVLKWDYQPFWLVLSYATATGASLVAIGVGFYAFKANGYAADTNFSTFLTTARSQSLDRLSRECCTEKTPLSKDFMKSKLSFNNTDGFIQSYGKDGGGQNDCNENVEKRPRLGKRICGTTYLKFFSILALLSAIAATAITVGVIEGCRSTSNSLSSSSSSWVSGANITDCTQDVYAFYVGAMNGPCYQFNGTNGFEVKNLESTCSVTVYSDIACSYNATAMNVGQCFTGYESFSVDGCS